jgi:hypothetical protein
LLVEYEQKLLEIAPQDYPKKVGAIFITLGGDDGGDDGAER